jgi:hypothetical protein
MGCDTVCPCVSCCCILRDHVSSQVSVPELRFTSLAALLLRPTSLTIPSLLTSGFGLQVFKRGQLKFAKQKYLKALKLLDHAFDIETDEQAGARKIPRPLRPNTPIRTHTENHHELASQDPFRLYETVQTVHRSC